VIDYRAAPPARAVPPGRQDLLGSPPGRYRPGGKKNFFLEIKIGKRGIKTPLALRLSNTREAVASDFT